jgi:HSP20 family protein
MANQRQGDGGARTQQGQGQPGQQGQQGQQGMTTRGQDQERGMARRSSAIGRPIARTRSPLSLMRRMMDDLDVMPFSGIGGMSSPFAMMRRMFNDMERMMESSMDISGDQGEQSMMGIMWAPRIDVLRRDNNLVVHADLPGIRPDQVRIFAQDNSLVIEGEREDVREDQSGDVWQSERVYGRFQRVVPLPEGVDSNAAQARFENGVLEISLPMSAESRGRQIEIQSGGQQGQQGQKGQMQSQGGQIPTGSSQEQQRH